MLGLSECMCGDLELRSPSMHLLAKDAPLLIATSARPTRLKHSRRNRDGGKKNSTSSYSSCVLS